MTYRKRRRMHRCSCTLCQEHPYGSIAQHHKAINRVLASLDEKNRRRFVGLLAIELGPRSLSLLSAITGLSRHTIRRGKQEIERPTTKKRTKRIRQPGGGRLPLEKNSPACYRPWLNCWPMTPPAIR